jgi:hypothetical protein
MVADELGDLTSLSKAADFKEEITGETFATEEINLGASEPSFEAPTAADVEVQTETIAELYRRQGLYDRAAEVYRALLRQRGEDVHLQAKLTEVEALANPVAGPEPVSETTAVEPEPWAMEPVPPQSASTTEPDADEAAAWLAGSSAPAESKPTPYAWTEQAAEVTPDTGRPIGDYFRSLLAWQPRVSETPKAVLDDSVGADVALEFVAEEPVAPEEPLAREAPLQEAATAEEAFEQWFGSAQSETVEETASQEAEPAAPSNAEASSSEEGDDDDDLEMFRSWLQSLKK